MANLLDLTSQGDVATITDESKLSQVVLMTPQQLYELWERQPWQSHTIDFTQDREDWAAIRDEDKDHIVWFLSSFFIGEERVATQFNGLVGAYESQSEEAFLTTQQVDEARHAQHFNNFYTQVVGYDGTLRGPPRARPRGPQRRRSRCSSTSVLVDANRRLLADPHRHRGQGRLRHDLPHGHRGDARADRPGHADARLRGARDPARLPRGLPADLPGRAPPRRLRHVVPAAEGAQDPALRAAHPQDAAGADPDRGRRADAPRLRRRGGATRSSACAATRSTASPSRRSRAG